MATSPEDPSGPLRSETCSRRAWLRWLRIRSRPWLPWLSLGLGIGSAFFLERTPERATWVAAASLGGLGLLGAYALANARTERSSAARYVRSGALMGSQSMLQLCLFFSLPFYAAAARLDPGHALFLGLLVALTAVSLWDPLYARVAARPRWAALVQGIGGFAGANVVLPMLGVENRIALLSSAGVLGLVGAVSFFSGRAAARPRWSLAFVVVPAVLATGAARVVPPAPLSLERMAFGLERVSPWIASEVETEVHQPRKLVCASAIAAPRGLSDRLVHRWSRDGVETDVIPLSIRGGRTEGFRTVSVKHNLPRGRWRCEVRTEAGQLLGGIEIWVR